MNKLFYFTITLLFGFSSQSVDIFDPKNGHFDELYYMELCSDNSAKNFLPHPSDLYINIERRLNSFKEKTYEFVHLYVHEVLPGVWLGSHESLKVENFFSRRISILSDHDLFNLSQTGISVYEGENHKLIKAYDGTLAWPILEPELSEIFQWIDEAIEKNGKERLLIHCWAGLSRSASVIVAYLINRFNLSFYDAQKYVATHRYIDINIALKMQLQIYEMKHSR